MLRTNFSKGDLPIYEEAIKQHKEETGSNRLFINKIATIPNTGEILKGSCALHDHESEDLSVFWNIFDKIKKNPSIIPMTKEDYTTQLVEIQQEAKQKEKDLAKKYATSNNPYKKGDVITDGANTIKITSMTWGYQFSTRIPQVVYRGDKLKKTGEPYKNGDIEVIYQSSIETK